MIDLVLWFVFIVFFVIQILLALNTTFINQKLPKKYKFVLSKAIDGAKTLETYSRVFRQVDLKVNAHIDDIAHSEKNFLMVSRKKIYDFDLFTNFFLIYKLEQTDPKNSSIYTYSALNNFAFFFQCTFIIISFLVPENIKTFTLGLGIFFLFFNFLIANLHFSLNEKILGEVFLKAKDLLDFDELDEARAEALSEELKHSIQDYPFDIFIKIINFFVP